MTPETPAEARLIATAPKADRRAAALAALAAAAGVAASWGFTVDDALISARVAHQLALGHGYRFNPSGPSIDCVTPLGWAHLLMAFAQDGPYRAMLWASALGATAWIAAAGALGARCATVCSGRKRIGLAIGLGACLPLGAWASAGMETAFVMALGVAALAPGLAGAAAAGLAAGLRPELAPWAAALALGSALVRRERASRCALSLGLALLPALAVAALRVGIFGRAAPLAVFAKPSDAAHGVRYALGALLLSGPTYFVLAGRATLRGLPRESWAILLASALHGVVLVGVGGDWMPFWRLALPTFPGLFFVGAQIAERSSPWANALRLGAALSCSVLLHAQLGPAARRVRADRERLMRETTPLLAGASRVASVDIGWVGVATQRDIVDLAGVADPEVAFLPGGHTSKRLPPDFLERRGVDALVLLANAGAAGLTPESFRRQVERAVPRLRGANEFQLRGRVPLDDRSEYWVFRRRPLLRAEAAP